MAAPSNAKRARRHGPVDITVACSPSQATLLTLKVNIQSTVTDIKKQIYQSSGIEEKWQELTYKGKALRKDSVFQDALRQDFQSGTDICLALHKDFIKECFLPKVPKVHLQDYENIEDVMREWFTNLEKTLPNQMVELLTKIFCGKLNLLDFAILFSFQQITEKITSLGNETLGLLSTAKLSNGKQLLYELIRGKCQSQLLGDLLAARDHIAVSQIEDVSSLMEMAVANYASEYKILADIAMILRFSASSFSLDIIKKLLDASVFAHCEQLLRKLVDDIKGSSSLSKTDRIELDKHLNRYLTEPLNMTVTNLLSTLSCSSYIIPRNQAHTRMCALIFYTTENREGAEEEAMKMKDRFSVANFVTHCVKISTIFEFEEDLISLLQSLAPSCSVMFVCIMAHGQEGVLEDAKGKTLNLTDMMHTVHMMMDACTPMITMIQSCQGMQFIRNTAIHLETMLDASRTSAPVNNSIELTRKHSVLLLSTVTGGASVRGLYSCALADQIGAADGKVDIATMHKAAVRQIERELDDLNFTQVPTMIDTTDKLVVIPGSASTSILSDSSRKFCLWYGTSDVISDWMFSDLKYYTMQEVRDQICGQTVRHMKIAQEVPNLTEFKSTLTHLSLVLLMDKEAAFNQIRQLSSLVHLSLADNSLVSVPTCIEQLVNLKYLYLEKNQLTEMNESVTHLRNLEVLDLKNNQLIELPDRIGDLKSLVELNIQGNKLQTLPKSFHEMANLRKLQIGGNEFSRLHDEVCKLRRLIELNLDSSSKLTALNPAMLNLDKKLIFSVTGCSSITEPPSSICMEGLPSILKFYKDLGDNRDNRIYSLTCGMIGETRAGKTSIVKTLQHRKRFTTQRQQGVDDGTKVFNSEKVDLGPAEIRFLDFGGEPIYHLAYQFTLESNFLPTVVVNMERFMELAESRGCDQATKKLCFDWMAQFYTACPNLPKPLLILTHKDKLEQLGGETLVGFYKSLFLETVESLRQDACSIARQTNSGAVITGISTFMNTVFPEENIFVIGNKADDYAPFAALTERIKVLAAPHIRLLPLQWVELIRQIEEANESHLDLEKLKSDSKDVEQLMLVLRLMHKSGRILWYESIKECAQTIFHKISEVKDMIAILFNNQSEAQWEKIMHDYKSSKSLSVYASYVEDFLKTGIMRKELIEDLLSKSKIPVPLSIFLLKKFLLIEDLVPKPSFAIPYLATQFMDDQWVNDGEFRLRTEVEFLGLLEMPQQVYYQMTAKLLRNDVGVDSQVELRKNGATIFHSGFRTHFIHSGYDSKITIQMSISNAEQMTAAWDRLIQSIQSLIQHTKRLWGAIRPVCTFYCGSCLLSGKNQPLSLVDPRWTIDERPTYRSGSDLIHCHTEGRDVPAVLVVPSVCIAAKDIGNLCAHRDEVRKDAQIHNEVLDADKSCDKDKEIMDGGGDGGSDSSQHSSESDEDIEDDDLSSPLKCLDVLMNKMKASLDLKCIPTPAKKKCLYHNTEKVYKMSAMRRGRALIISNRFDSDPRPSSELDFNKLSKMLGDFDFEVSGSHKNYTAQEIHDEIDEETQHEDHTNYGMFVLAIFSHGNAGKVFGDDEKSIQISDIKGMLCETKFPAMRGKPKLVIINACRTERVAANESCPESHGNMRREGLSEHGGGDWKRDRDGGKTRFKDWPAITVKTPHEAFQERGRTLTHTSTGSFSMEHLMVIMATQDGHASFRRKTGSYFIHAVVVMFYRYAQKADLEKLSKYVQEQVRLKTKIRSEKKEKDLGQIPDPSCTFSRGRKVYLFPGYHGI